MPASYSPTAAHRWRLDTWFHGRSESLSEVNFLSDRQRTSGEFAPRDTIVLHLYGRFCNASKFAGEVDLFEALAAVKRQYPIDDNRILIRGFSMGGASAWHIGTHFAGLWAAVSPGAGFAETALYQKMNLNGPNAPPAWEQKLFHLYDAADYAANLFNTSTIEYHGELDPQQQAGDVMEKNMAAEGLRLIRLIGPKTEHRFHPETKIELARMLDGISRARPRSLPVEGPLHDVDAGIQPDEVGDGGCTRKALGARACRRPNRAGQRGRGADVQRHCIHAGYGPRRLAARHREQAHRHRRRPEAHRARSEVRPLVDRAFPQVRRPVVGRRDGRSPGCTSATASKVRLTTRFSTASSW
jgi:hypothetical protein